ncbi:uncharacterized membrane protein At1g16860-like [Impatiens glandulifera]|uniref:uncharacterized membrane protein At1g16860-like n=1 Tax=Impatiens glandulifera TaxID=253017 RepID=UPI001FB11B70|nr:uncharacterized membrane protein At1g16860-like [Impatiens glandulifera]
MVSSKIISHQLSNGLYVSGQPEQLKARSPTMAAREVPYTGGDIKKSRELGKMFDICNSSDQLTPIKKTLLPSSSFPQKIDNGYGSGYGSPGGTKSARNSGPLLSPIQKTGLITSSPLGTCRPGQFDSNVGSSSKPVYGSSVTNLVEEMKIGFKVSKLVICFLVVLMVMGLMVGAFLMVVFDEPVFLTGFGGILALVIMALIWNFCWKKKGLLGFLKNYPNSDLRGAIDGQYVKISGIVTCGNIPLETSFRKVSRCVYISTELKEYKGKDGKSANPKHKSFSWGCRYVERYVTDFYVSDFQTGLRALVKAGSGAKVVVLVEDKWVFDANKEENRELSPSFLCWLADRNLSSDDRVMRLEEGYINEGSTVSVMGVIRRQGNVIMIVPSIEPLSTGCQWTRCLLPTYTKGMVLMCHENHTNNVISV